MMKVTMFVGLNDQVSHQQEISTIDAFKVVSNIFRETTGGATITEGTGVYTHDDGSLVVEKSLICLVYGADMEHVIEAADQIKVALNQESVIIETCEVNSMFH